MRDPLSIVANMDENTLAVSQKHTTHLRNAEVREDVAPETSRAPNKEHLGAQVGVALSGVNEVWRYTASASLFAWRME